MEPEWAVDLDDMIEALQEEIRAAASSSAGSIVVTDGRLLHESGEGALYSFRTSRPLGLEPDTPLKIEVEPLGETTGRLVAEADAEVVIQADESLSEQVPEASLKADAGFIFSRAIERLEDLADEVFGNGPQEVQVTPSGAKTATSAASSTHRDVAVLAHMMSLITRPGTALHPEVTGDPAAPPEPSLPSPLVLLDRGCPPNEGQLRALQACVGRRLHFVWGPPGTGKTANLAQTVRYLAAPLGEGLGHRVLVVAHANAAVDVAAAALAAQFAGTDLLASGKVVRWGTAQLPEVWALPEIQPARIIERFQPELMQRVRALADEQGRLLRVLRAQRGRSGAGGGNGPQSLQAVAKELKEARRRLKLAALQVLASARVVATTLSRFVLEQELYGGAWDTVVVDEASMAPLPMVVAGFSRAARKGLVYGDFRQLPPIHQSRAPLVQRWLGRDAFEAAGVKDAAERHGHHPCLSMLDLQYRMVPTVCAGVGRLAYMDRLRTAEGVEERMAAAVASAPWPGESAVVLDTSAWAPVCTREDRPQSYSRFNPLHALLAAEIAHAASVAGLSIGLMSPYRAQALLTQALVEGQFEREKGGAMARNAGCLPMAGTSPVLSATVHRFQGSERDLVLFDVTDAEPEAGASFLTGRDRDTALRLCTVALSRGRAKSIILLDRAVLAQPDRSFSPLGDAVAIWREIGAMQELDAVTKAGLASGTGTSWFCDWSRARGALSDDVEAGLPWEVGPENLMVLNLPPGFRVDARSVATLRTWASRTQGVGQVFCDSEQAEELEEALAELTWDLRLLPLHPGLLVFLGRELVYVGGREPGAPVARVVNRRFAERLRRMVGLAARQALRPGLSTAAAGSRLCPECGAAVVIRREKGSWVSSCPRGCGTPTVLDRETLGVVLRNMKAVCPLCGAQLVVRGTGRDMFAACSRYRRGCEGFTVRLSDLLGR